MILFKASGSKAFPRGLGGFRELREAFFSHRIAGRNTVPTSQIVPPTCPYWATTHMVVVGVDRSSECVRQSMGAQ